MGAHGLRMAHLGRCPPFPFCEHAPSDARVPKKIENNRKTKEVLKVFFKRLFESACKGFFQRAFKSFLNAFKRLFKCFKSFIK